MQETALCCRICSNRERVRDPFAASVEAGSAPHANPDRATHAESDGILANAMSPKKVEIGLSLQLYPRSWRVTRSGQHSSRRALPTCAPMSSARCVCWGRADICRRNWAARCLPRLAGAVDDLPPRGHRGRGRVLARSRIFGRPEGSDQEVKSESVGVWSVRDRKLSRVDFYPTRNDAIRAMGLAQ